MIIKFKNLIKYLISSIVGLFIFSSKDIKTKSILLIRLDAIGDYILFRNFIEELKKSNKYKGYNITLVGNSVWKSLAEELDEKYIEKFIWINRDKFSKNLIYRYNKLKEITSSGYNVVINPSYSRDFYDSDSIVQLVSANEKIGSIGDLSNIEKWQKNISTNYYDRLIGADHNLMFEFKRNREFFENLLETKLDIIKPIIKLKEKELNMDLPKNYVVIFIGASASFRKWDIKKFIHIANYLRESYGYDIILCGGSTDIEEAKEFKKYFQNKYIDLVGKTTLIDLLYIISNGNLMISNETSAPHFAVALEMIKIIVISNGNHFGRFTPYPKDVSENYHVVYHPEIEKDLDNYKKLCNSYGCESKLNINDITVEMVKERIDQVL